MTGRVDLHTHTTASDGTLSPRELVLAAVRQSVTVLAVTDHDSTEGLSEAMTEAAKHAPLTIVPGLEINCDVEGAEIHVLGYLVNYAAPWFQEFLREQRAERVTRVHRIAERLGELGMPIDPAEVFTLAGEGAAGRPHVAQVMVKRGYVKSVREAFDKYLRSGGPANVPRRRLTPQEAVRVIRRAGGVPVLAHPGLAGRDELIPELVAVGLLGIETYYAEHSAAQVTEYLSLCRRYDLVATGGSDYHGPQSGRTNPVGTPAVPWAAWEELQRRADGARREPAGG
ncbi:MAG TPA: PHP domain-containing protein [Methylomirabilota bacterium]|nr:PHP domain-containing protein [Methylomirabilota bacterium]